VRDVFNDLTAAGPIVRPKARTARREACASPPQPRVSATAARLGGCERRIIAFRPDQQTLARAAVQAGRQ